MTEPTTTPAPTPSKPKKPRKSDTTASPKAPGGAKQRARKPAAEKTDGVHRVDPRPKSRLRSYPTEVAVETRVKLREFSAEFTEDEVRDILKAHVTNVLLPEHYRAARKPVPAEHAAENVHSTILHVPTVQDEYQPDGKFELRLRFKS